MATGRLDAGLRRRWLDDKRGKRDILLKKLEAEAEAEADPNERERLRRQIARYKALITMGPEPVSEATAKANAARVP